MNERKYIAEHQDPVVIKQLNDKIGDYQKRFRQLYEKNELFTKQGKYTFVLRLKLNSLKPKFLMLKAAGDTREKDIIDNMFKEIELEIKDVEAEKLVDVRAEVQLMVEKSLSDVDAKAKFNDGQNNVTIKN